MKTAIVLFNLGGPSSLADVQPFLFNLFSDPYIVNLPAIFRIPLARILAWRREKEAQKIYVKLGGKSPLLENTLKQKEALQKILSPEERVFVSMRYSQPFFEEVLEDIKSWGGNRIIFLPLYPQFSSTTTFSFYDQAKTILKKSIPYRLVCCYPQNEKFIEALSDTVDMGLTEVREKTPYVLFSAHGLPISVIKRGDPYEWQIQATAKAVNACIEKRRGFLPYVPIVCYQSKVGPLPWLGPSLDEALLQASQHKKPVIVVPLSFVSEHSETLVELDEVYKIRAEKLGIPCYVRVSTVQNHPLFIQGLKDLIEEAKENFKDTPLSFFKCPEQFKFCPCRRKI